MAATFSDQAFAQQSKYSDKAEWWPNFLVECTNNEGQFRDAVRSVLPKSAYVFAGFQTMPQHFKIEGSVATDNETIAARGETVTFTFAALRTAEGMRTLDDILTVIASNLAVIAKKEDKLFE